jgi:glycosyltransferase involved in cell wall biosynthesis
VNERVARRYLVVTFSYAPKTAPRAFRWQPIAEAWAARGIHVDVVTEQVAGAPVDEVLNGVHVHRVRRPSLDGVLRGRLRRGAGGRGPFAWLWRRVHWPDDKMTWIWPAVRAVRRLMRDREYDVVISVSWSVVGHVVAHLVHRPTRLWTWIMDVGDPFCFHVMVPPNNLALYDGLNHRYERRLFRLADAVSVTTPRTASRYAALFPESAAKIAVIPPLFSAPPPADGRASIFPADGKIRLVFTGAMRRVNRRPDVILDVFARLRAMPEGDRFELHLAGSGSAGQVRETLAAAPEEARRAVVAHGVVPRATALRMIREADVLVSLGYVGDYQLPSKLVDYVSTGKPIVNVATIADDTSAEFLRRYPAALLLTVLAPGDVALAAERLHELIVRRPPPVDRRVIDEMLAPHRLEAVLAAYDDLISRAEASRPRRTPAPS